MQTSSLPLLRTFRLPISIPLELVLVEKGSFMMGSPADDPMKIMNELPQHKVTLTQDFYMGKYVVTEGQWKAVMGKQPSRVKEVRVPQYMSHWDARLFIDRLNELLQQRVISKATPGYFAMPTEAQWEYAARGGNKSQGFAYAGSDKSSEVAWHFLSPNRRIHAVGQLKPNELGLYDMSGNTLEWCVDVHGPYSPEDAVDPIGEEGMYYVSRGGSWELNPRMSRVAARTRGNLGGGLRLVFYPEG